MKKILLTILLLTCSCSVTDIKMTNGQSVDNSTKPVKTGIACVRNFFGITTFGDSSIEAAKKDGDIKNVSFVDTSLVGFQGYFYNIYQRVCTIVKGD